MAVVCVCLVVVIFISNFREKCHFAIEVHNFQSLSSRVIIYQMVFISRPGGGGGGGGGGGDGCNDDYGYSSWHIR